MEKRAASSSVHAWNVSDKHAVTDAQTRGNSVTTMERKTASSSVQPRDDSDNTLSTGGGPQQAAQKVRQFCPPRSSEPRPAKSARLLSRKYLQSEDHLDELTEREDFERHGKETLSKNMSIWKAEFGAEVTGKSEKNERIATKPRSPLLEPMRTHYKETCLPIPIGRIGRNVVKSATTIRTPLPIRVKTPAMHAPLVTIHPTWIGIDHRDAPDKAFLFQWQGPVPSPHQRPHDTTANQVFSLPAGRQVVLHFDNMLQPTGQSGGLLTRVLVSMANDFSLFPIGVRSWRQMIIYKDREYNRQIKARKNLEGYKGNLFNKFYDDSKSLSENVQHRCSEGIDTDDWQAFLEYRLEEDTLEIRHKRYFSRREMWTMVHRRKDGSYIHDDARAICEEIDEIESRDESINKLSQNDSLAQVLGKEHSE
ncbi:hypothetical protein PIB30_018576 [Stylosanthes scabra]|uniref:Uncharacterized protein n=1 Tax=Stylosanthes scabra TaxID=79078 RepID=A0ABU6R8A1_9FABA|nr:hypothetical protein [Stylosanthes scabra]